MTGRTGWSLFSKASADQKPSQQKAARCEYCGCRCRCVLRVRCEHFRARCESGMRDAGDHDLPVPEHFSKVLYYQH